MERSSILASELPKDEPERSRTSTNTSAAQSRRAKNAAHRADDVGTYVMIHFSFAYNFTRVCF